MNKIIIDPHYCSREEYQELKDYLEEKCWDWQEVSPGDVKKDDRRPGGKELCSVCNVTHSENNSCPYEV